MQKSALWEEIRDEGRLEALRDTLFSQVEERFGAVPAELAQRIRTTTDLDRLRAALRRVLKVQSLEDLAL